MEWWSTYPTAAECVNGITVDTRMVAAIQPLPVWILIGSVLFWIVAILPFVADARNFVKYSIEEEVPKGTLIGNVLKDSHLKRTLGSSVINEIYFSFLADVELAIAIEPKTGVLKTSGRIDRENISNCYSSETCEVTVDVAVQPVKYFQIIKVTIEILDINDNVPMFPENEITHPILESAEPGSSFAIPTATDLDSPKFGVLRYELESHRNTFGIRVQENVDGSLDVRLTIERRLDRERRHRYRIKVVAYDGGQPPKQGRTNIVIPILDSNDNSPVFDRPVYDVNIPENLAPGTSVIQVQAADPDLGQNGKVQYKFSIQSENLYGHMLAINPTSGEIFVKGELDREKVAVCNLVVTARDQGPNAVPADTTVVVTITDINDNAPEILVSTLGSSRPNVAKTPEDADVGTFVAHVSVSDPDEGANGQVNCTLNDYTFSLEQTFEKEYQIVTSRVLDRESIPQYRLEIVCTDKGRQQQVTRKRITVVIGDVNDNSPKFTQKSYTATMLENNMIGVTVLQTLATDMDAGSNGEIRYRLSEDVHGIFDVDSQTGAILTKARVDREITQQFEFHVMATDLGHPAKSSFAPILINIEDVDDELPRFVRPTFSFRIAENQPVGSEVGKVTAVDLDVPPNNQFYYAFLNEELSGAFFLNSKTGQITSQQDLDRETQDSYRLIIGVMDQNEPSMSSTAVVNIQIMDANDNPPRLVFPTPANNTIHVSNRVPVGSVLAQIKAYDADTGENARMTFTLAAGNEEKVFHLDPDTGLLTSNMVFTDINYATFPLVLQIVDHGVPPYRVEQELKVVINSTIPFPPPKPQVRPPARGQNFHYNVIVVVAVACGATVIVVSFVICVVLVRKNRRKRQNHCSGKANGPTEARCMLNRKESRANGEDHIALKDVGHPDISESMRKLLTANTADWDKCSSDVDAQVRWDPVR
ncbi:hypothetical protein LSH36_12g31003 [Paralvinella palmiformis]|uniref:Cadherin domain-containing protein n=1 Tax=Paralvinella palmiformis TaxID=53620 RepID=A0AAD9KDA0_9ANNE|nr:hypothetical protein LSH36_12g31003 [Paralvinella palmiformis]